MNPVDRLFVFFFFFLFSFLFFFFFFFFFREKYRLSFLEKAVQLRSPG